MPPDVPPLHKPAQALPENVKRFIVIRNGCGVAPREIILAVKEHFGLMITSPQVARYDPTKAAGQTLCEEYKRLFAPSRGTAQETVRYLGISDQKYRMSVLHNLCVQAVENDQPWQALRILKQVAREKCAGVYSKGPVWTKKQLALREKLRLCRPEDLPPLTAPDPPDAKSPAPRKLTDWEEGWAAHSQAEEMRTRRQEGD